MAQPTELIRLALFGSPVCHSLSPAIHTEFAAQTGLQVDYIAIEADKQTFPCNIPNGYPILNKGGHIFV